MANQTNWTKLKRPILALAPMADVTDAAFRRVIAKYGKPDVMWTEFVSCDGLCSVKGRPKLLPDLRFTEAERPIVAQIFGATPRHFEECAKLIYNLGFDGIDINMGCPDKKVEKQGAGAALIKNPKLAKEIILATKRGAGGLPVSVKTRIGYRDDTLEVWLKELLKAEPDALIFHLRTRKEMSLVPAKWERIGAAVKLVNKLCKGKYRPLIIGNGDVVDMADARAKAKQYGVDGVMIGRGIFGNPWLFSNRATPPSVEEKLRVLVEHTKLFEKLMRGVKSFDVMKKHYKAYVTGFDGAKELRIKLMEVNSALMVEKIVRDFLKIEWNKDE